jgi:CubicO group peptidase (beta-lactamase class C family)
MLGKSDIIRSYFAAYRSKDRKVVDRLLADDFRFTSPYDDAIDKASYFAKCWPNSEWIRAHILEKICEDGDEAFVRYECVTHDGKKFRNTECFRFAGERISKVDVYFGATHKDGAFVAEPMRPGGLSRARLGRMHDVMAGHVARGRLPGLVTLIRRRGETHVDAIGTKAVDGSDPMRRDTIFRIASMTKPVTAVAAMILVEEARLRLDDPVDPWLPELADRKVLRAIDSPLDDTVPSRRPITLRDLLTFRLGLGAVMAPPRRYPIQQAMADAGVAPGPNLPSIAPDELMKRFGSLPLLHQPGEKWMYHSGSDILGVLLARVTGQTLETFLRERIFAPLGMNDTAFSVPDAKLDRLASCYQTDTTTGEIALFDDARGGRWSRPAVFEAGGGGLVSTVDDYLAFGLMMLNKGRHAGDRILSRLSVELMTTDQITPEQKAASPFFPGFWDNRGWGFGVSMITRRDDMAAVPGRFGWDGGYGTSWYADPKEDMVAILMTQRLWDSPVGPAVYGDFWTSAYQAIDD